MELFSKRYKSREFDEAIATHQLKNRVLNEIKYVISSNKYLEGFLILDDQIENKYYLHTKTLSDLSLRELGYDLKEAFDCRKMVFDFEHYEFGDFFDFVELLIIFTKRDKRKIVCERIQNIFDEEGSNFILHNFLIFVRDETGLQSILPLIKDKQLKEKLSEYYSGAQVGKPNYQVQARTSADILQMIFSAPSKQKQTKNFTQELCKKVASKWTNNKNTEALSNLISESVKNAKSLNNEISNIRHNDKFTIPVDYPNFYKLIASNNFHIAELVILSLPNEFISDQDPEDLKESYLRRYNLKKDTGWYIENKEKKAEDLPTINPPTTKDKEEINVEDIPF